MLLTFGGVRGSGLACGADYINFGADTTSLLITDNNLKDKNNKKNIAIIIDSGTGIRNFDNILDDSVDSVKDIYILLTHYHLDHIAGLALFKKIYQKDINIKINGPVLDSEKFTAKDAFLRIFSRPIWPVELDKLPCNLSFNNIINLDSSWDIEAFYNIKQCLLNHPGGSVAYRIEQKELKKSIVIATDVEWALANLEYKKKFIDLCTQPYPIELLIFDGHFQPQNYQKFKGWGHSSWLDAVGIANMINVKKLFITHHNPYKNDKELLAIEKEAKDNYNNIIFARQGEQVVIN